MINSFYKIIQEAIGFHMFSYTSLMHMIIRSFFIYIFGVTLARFNKKLIGIRTPFNFILFVMLGSISANAVVDGILFIPILCTILFLILLNGFMTMLAFYFYPIELFLKGGSSILVKDSAIQWKAMRKNFITKTELFNELHTQLHTDNLDKVKTAFLASDGTINFITKL